nr:transposase [Azospirillum oryzae]
MLLAQRVRPGPAGDLPDLVPLTTDASAVMAFDEVIADAGYDSEANHRFCRETLGVHSLIPAKKRRSIRSSQPPHTDRRCTAYSMTQGMLPASVLTGSAGKSKPSCRLQSGGGARPYPPAPTSRNGLKHCSEMSPTTSTALFCLVFPHEAFDRARRSNIPSHRATTRSPATPNARGGAQPAREQSLDNRSGL